MGSLQSCCQEGLECYQKLLSKGLSRELGLLEVFVSLRAMKDSFRLKLTAIRKVLEADQVEVE